MTLSSKKMKLIGLYFRQNWSLPDTLIYYITKNPSSSKIYQKLIQSCKYFFIKNPIIVVQYFGYNFSNELVVSLNGEKGYKLAYTPQQFWITDTFDIRERAQTCISSFIPKLYRVDVRYIYLSDQIITFKEFIFLSSNVEEISFNNVTVKSEGGSIVALENLIEPLSKVTKVVFFDNPLLSSITKNTAKKLPHFSKICYFCLNKISELFDIDVFLTELKENKNTKFYISFDHSISAGYITRLNAIVDELITSDKKIKVFINFNELAHEKYQKLSSLFF